jgi:hypothetical protein
MIRSCVLGILIGASVKVSCERYGAHKGGRSGEKARLRYGNRIME